MHVRICIYRFTWLHTANAHEDRILYTIVWCTYTSSTFIRCT